MLERESRRVQELPFEPEIARAPIQGVAGDGQVDGREMHADLVGPARFEGDPQEGMSRQELLHLEMRHGVARRIGVEGLSERVVAVTPDRGVDRAPQRTRPSADKCDVLPRQRAGLHELLQPAVRLGRAGDDEQP